MTKTLTFEYDGKTIILEDRMEESLILCFANPSWRVVIRDRSDKSFQFRLMHGDISVDDKTDDKLIFDYGCVCMVPPKKNLHVDSCRFTDRKRNRQRNCCHRLPPDLQTANQTVEARTQKTFLGSGRYR